MIGLGRVCRQLRLAWVKELLQGGPDTPNRSVPVIPDRKGHLAERPSPTQVEQCRVIAVAQLRWLHGRGAVPHTAHE